MTAAAMTTEADIDPWLTLAEAARRTGFHEDTMRRAIKRGDLAASGGGVSGLKIRVRQSALDTWMDNRGRGGGGTS